MQKYCVTYYHKRASNGQAKCSETKTDPMNVNWFQPQQPTVTLSLSEFDRIRDLAQEGVVKNIAQSNLEYIRGRMVPYSRRRVDKHQCGVIPRSLFFRWMGDSTQIKLCSREEREADGNSVEDPVAIYEFYDKGVENVPYAPSHYYKYHYQEKKTGRQAPLLSYNISTL